MKNLQPTLFLVILILLLAEMSWAKKPSPTGCQSGISNFPYTESFENGFGAWTQGANDDIDWTHHSGATRSSNTGPSKAAHEDHYLYVEASFGNHPNKVANLYSPCINVSAMANKNLSFSYHMFGNNMGTLTVDVSTDNWQTWTTLWDRTSNQGNGWKSVEIFLQNFSGLIQIRIKGQTGTSYTSDIAIDNIVIGGTPICNNTVAVFPYGEGFESNFGLWNNDSEDDIDWRRNSNGTTSNGTGPNGSANNGSTYIYIESSTKGVGYPTKTANLESPCVALDYYGNSIIFNYHMLGASMGTLNLQISTNGGKTWSTIWSKSGSQGSGWKVDVVDLSDYFGVVKLRFNGVTGLSFTSDMALDNIHIVPHLTNNNNRMATEEAEEEETEPSKISIKNYPNPFQNFTTIEYTLVEETPATLTITDVSGKIVAQPFANKQQDRGTHKVEFQASNLPPGLYFYTLQTGAQKVTKQMLIFNQ